MKLEMLYYPSFFHNNIICFIPAVCIEKKKIFFNNILCEDPSVLMMLHWFMFDNSAQPPITHTSLKTN